jgi:hypothetical protein
MNLPGSTGSPVSTQEEFPVDVSELLRILTLVCPWIGKARVGECV